MRRSNRTAGKSPASVVPALKPARKATSSALGDTSARKDIAAPKDTAAHGVSEKFSGERKGPPEAIVPAPEVIVPRLPTLRETSARKDIASRKETAAHGGSEKFSGERKGPPEAIMPVPK